MQKRDSRPIVGFLTAGIEDEFSRNLEHGVMQRADEENVNLVVFPGKFINRYGLGEFKYEYQYNSVFAIPCEENVDAIIIAADTIGTFANKDQIHDFIQRYIEIPCILIAAKDGVMSSITYDNCKGIEDAVAFLCEERKCTKFAMFCGPSGSTDATERKNSFVNKLSTYGITLGEDQFVEGDFSPFCQKEAEVLLDKNPDVQAVFCANDDMATCLYEAMYQRGIIPGKDVYVFGYDNSIEAGQLRPSLSSIWADPMELSRQAFDMAMNLIRGRKTPNRILDTMFVRRDSFGDDGINLLFSNMERETIDEVYNKIFYRLQGASGREFKVYRRIVNDCIDIIEAPGYDKDLHKRLLNDYEAAIDMGIIKYADMEIVLDVVEELFAAISAGEERRKDRKEVRENYAIIYKALIMAQERELHDVGNANMKLDSSMKMVTQDIMQFSNGNDQNYAIPLRKLPMIGVQNAYMYMLERPITRLFSDTLETPNALLLKAYLENGEVTSVPAYRQKIKIDDVFVNDFMNTDRINMVMLPLYANEILYGFLLCDMSEQIFSNGELLVNVMSSAVKTLYLLRSTEEIKEQLEQSLTALKQNNIELDNLSKEDPMTGIFNRRGFIEAAKNYLEKCKAAGEIAMVMYVDMDNLKIVNDRYGHDEGDFSLKLIADTVKDKFGTNGIVGRIGGDEFACITSIDKTVEEIKSIIKDSFEQYNASSAKPYNVSASAGIYRVDFEDSSMGLEEALALADDDLYEEKKNRTLNVAKN